jgi:hypothetical protein
MTDAQDCREKGRSASAGKCGGAGAGSGQAGEPGGTAGEGEEQGLGRAIHLFVTGVAPGPVDVGGAQVQPGCALPGPQGRTLRYAAAQRDEQHLR